MRWTLNKINWAAFDARGVENDLLSVVKTAALVEANSADYVTYLKNVFPNDPAFHAAIEMWGEEEAQHGAALGRWAEIADPDFSFARALDDFRAGYQLDLETDQSVRGSRLGELVARSVVESGTSSFYCAIRDASKEPLLKQIAHHIAADEFAHYQLFQKHLKRYEKKEPLGRFKRLLVAAARVQEAEDDELAYAFYAANVIAAGNPEPFNGLRHAQAYYRVAFGLYEQRHIDNATRMILRAANFQPQGIFANIASRGFWTFIKLKRARMQSAA